MTASTSEPPAHTADDPRSSAEVARYRDALESLVADIESMPDEQVTPLMFAATATRIRLILAGHRP